MVYEAGAKFSSIIIITSLHRVDMARLVIVLLIPVILNFRRCESSIETLKIQNDQNSELLDQIEQDSGNINQNSKSEMAPVSKITNGQLMSDDNSQLSLKRPSRTAKHNLPCPFHLKCKHDSYPFNHFKGYKFGLLPEFFKHFSGILKSFMFEIEKILSWWHVALLKLKGQIKQKQIASVSTNEIKMMHAKFPIIKNKILELIAFFSKFFHFNGNDNYHDFSKIISIDIEKSLRKIKHLALSFIMLLKGSECMNSDSNNKLVQVKAYFDSIPADKYAILNHGLVNGQKNTDINGNSDINLGFNEKTNILKGQSHMLRIMWDYINELPAIFTVILEIMAELFTAIDWKSSSFHCNRPNHPPLSPPSHIFDPHSVQMFHDGSHTKSFINFNNPHKKLNAQLGYTAFQTNDNIFSHDLVKKELHPSSIPRRDWFSPKISLEKFTVLSLLGATQLTIGDIVILHLTDNIILVGRVDDNVNPIIFNVIYHRVSQKSSYTRSTTIWNLSYQHLSGNSRIYNDIMSYI